MKSMSNKDFNHRTMFLTLAECKDLIENGISNPAISKRYWELVAYRDKMFAKEEQERIEAARKASTLYETKEDKERLFKKLGIRYTHKQIEADVKSKQHKQLTTSEMFKEWWHLCKQWEFDEEMIYTFDEWFDIEQENQKQKNECQIHRIKRVKQEILF